MKRKELLSKALALALTVLTLLWFYADARAQEAKPNGDSTIADGQARLVVQLGHSYQVHAVAISADGKYVVTDDNNTALLWEAETGREVRRFKGHSDTIGSVAFSADGRYIVTGSLDTTARLWNVETGKEVRRFETGDHSKANPNPQQSREDWISAVVYSPDGKYLVIAGYSNTLWEVGTGKKVRQFSSGSATSVAFSPDGRYLLTGHSWSRTPRLWEVNTGDEIRRFEAAHSDKADSSYQDWITAVAYSPDGKYAVTGSRDKRAYLWEIGTGREVRQFQGHSDEILAVTYSPDGKYVATGSKDSTVRLWDVKTGRETRRFEGHSSQVLSVTYTLDGKYILTGSMDGTARLWAVETGREVRRFEGHSSNIASGAFSRDGKYILTGGLDHTARLWEAETGREARQFKGHSDTVASVALSPDGKYALTGSWDKTARLWDANTGKEIRRFEGHSDEIWSVAYSPDGRYVLTGGFDEAAKMWDVESGKEVRQFKGNSYGVLSVAYSLDGKYVLTGGFDRIAKLWEVESGREVRRFEGHSSLVMSVAFSHDGKYVVTGSDDDTVRVWKVETGKEARRFDGYSSIVWAVTYSPDDKYVLIGDSNGMARLLEVETGKEVRRFEGHSAGISSVAFSPDGRYIMTGSFDGTTRLWDASNGKQVCSLVSFRDGTWAVTDTDGRYDASNNGDVNGMHWVVGNESIALSQLKHRYYEPGLLAKILKGEPLRNVSSFKNVKLYPDVAYRPPAPGSTQFRIDLRNRGGGIGRVTVLVNGKEVSADARGPRVNPQAAKAEITVELSGGAIKPGQENDIRVLAYNAEGYLSSRGPVMKWMAPGQAEKDPPALYAIVGGISQYKSESMNLRYAARDAEDFAHALRVGAKNLFGIDKVHLTVLSTSGNDGTIRPTKDNFKRAFEAARKARPGDVLVVYLAGHGMAQRLSADSETYCYLTEEWRGGSLNDEVVRGEQSITSDDLAEWIKRIPALKQVMMLDTCAAGAVAEKLKLIDKRLPSSDQIRALDRLKDRTGFHVLMGAAADKVSYETSQFGHGLLTYALLEGMKYRAVKNEIVEVSSLFQYVRDRVPELARESGIGGVQQPQIMAPKADSFPVIRMTSRDSESIYLARAKLFVMRPRIINPQDADDDELEKAVRRALREESEPVMRGTGRREPRLAYLDDGELPSAVRTSGTFVIGEDKRIRITITLKRGEQKVSFEVTGTNNDIAALSTKIVEQIAEALKAFK